MGEEVEGETTDDLGVAGQDWPVRNFRKNQCLS